MPQGGRSALLSACLLEHSINIGALGPNNILVAAIRNLESVESGV